MKSILILSSIYPGPYVPETFTPVVHYFAKEFLAMGYDVRVVSTSTYYPKLIYTIPSFIKDIFSSILGFSFPKNRLNTEEEYKIDGIKVVRIPIYKRIPMGSFNKKILDDEIDKILSYIRQNNYRPDIVVGHWTNPQLYLVTKIGEILNVKTALVAHEHAPAASLVPEYENLVGKIDVWGFRSQSIKDSFYNAYHIKSSFQCHSGIPQEFFVNPVKRDYQTSNRYVFVGNLIKRKYPDVALQSVMDTVPDNFTFNIVGDGPMMNNLCKIANKSSIIQKVIFRGRLPRTKIIEILDESDIFIMISRNEVFGLVYLEAMARGCIVIASKNEGMEGIIYSGENGFLINAGDPIALKECLTNISKMTPDSRRQISEKAMETAKEFSDSKVAMKYLNAIINE